MVITKPIIWKIPTTKQVKIIPIFDMHIGAKEFKRSEFLDFIKQYKDDPDAYFVLGGDIINNGIKSSVSNSYNETIRPSDQKKQAIELLYPIKDKIICAVSGNHEQRSRKETDDDIIYDICSKLDIDNVYREDIGFIFLKVPKKSNSKRYNTYTIAVTHGIKSLNNVSKFALGVSGLDIIIVGHTHKPSDTPQSRFVMVKRTCKVKKENFSVVVASSWLEWGDYASRAMLLPTARVKQEIILGDDEPTIDIKQCW